MPWCRRLRWPWPTVLSDYAADLVPGQPMAHCMRQTVIALRLADLAGATAERQAAWAAAATMTQTAAWTGVMG